MSKVGASNFNQILSTASSTETSAKTSTRPSHDLASTRHAGPSTPVRDFENLRKLRGPQFLKEINKQPLKLAEIENLQNVLSTRPLNVQKSVTHSLIKSNVHSVDAKAALTTINSAIETRISNKVTPDIGAL
jgi:hypothetical protein